MLKGVGVGAAAFDLNEIGWRKILHVLIVDNKGLDGADDDLRMAPIIAMFFEDHGGVIIAEVFDEVLFGLLVELDSVNEEKDTLGVAGLEEELDDRGGDKGFTGAGGHLEQEAGVALVRAGLQFAHCFDLIITQDAEFFIVRIAGTRGGVLKAGITQIVRVLRDGDEIRFDRFLRKAAWIGLEGAAVADGFARGELGDDLGVAVFEVPEIVNIAIGEDDEAHVLGIGVGARLLFADEGIFLLPFSFDDE